MEQLEIQSHNFQEKILKNKSNYDQKGLTPKSENLIKTP